MDDLEAQQAQQFQQQQRQQKATNDGRRAQARDLVTSWFLAVWAVIAAVYLIAGGARHLVSPSYHFVLTMTGGNPRTVAVLLLVASIVNIVGVSANRPWGIAIGAILVGVWLAFMSFAMALAAWTVPDGGNLNMLSSGGLAVCFFIPAYNKVYPPNPNVALGFMTMAALWFI